MKMCKCEQLNNGAQLFRIKSPSNKFRELHDLGPDFEKHFGSRKVWQCRKCGQLFAYMLIPYKDEEQFIVRAKSNDWNNWDWNELASIADSVRWRGFGNEKRCLW